MTASTSSVEVPQHLVALERANEVRLARAAFKRSLKADGSAYAPLRVAHALCRPDRPTELDSMSLYELLKACPRLTRATALRVLAAAGASEILTVGASTFRQRQAIAAALDERAGQRLSPRARIDFERSLKDM